MARVGGLAMSSVFGNRPNNQILSAIEQAKSFGNPQALYQSMYQTNPSFRKFADSMRGKTPEQAFRENGLDIERFRNFL